MARRYQLITKQGQRYFVHHDDAIERADGQNGPGSQDWTFAGLIATNPGRAGTFSMVSGGKALGYATANDISLTYKNGKPKYTVADRDHGTYREWGDGVVSIERVR